MKPHPIHAKNEDIGCRWLCMCSGNMSANDRAAVRKAMDNLPFRCKPLNVPEVNMIARVK